MARILADAFVLVVGNGQTYSKTDLVEDAKSGKTRHAHQEDSAQTVRVWRYGRGYGHAGGQRNLGWSPG